MKAKVYLLIALITLSGLLIATTPVNAAETSVQVFSSHGTISQAPTETYSHIIRISGSNYIVENGLTGAIEFQSTNAAQAITNGLSRGGSILIKAGTYPITTTAYGQGVNDVTLVFEEGAKLVLANNVNAPVLWITGVSDWLIVNPEIDGNMANNQEFTDTDGLIVHDSRNVHVDEAYIYNVRIFGFYVNLNCENCGITNSLVTNCGWNCITLSDSTGSYAIGNEVSHCGDVGITCYSWSGIIQNNYVHDIDGTEGSQLSPDSINSHWAIGVEGGADTIITGNTVINAGYGVVVHNSGNTASRGMGDAITISSNTFQNIQSCGIEIHSSDNVVSNNQIIDWSSGKNAITIELGLAGSNTANNNQIIDNILSSQYANANGINVRTGVINTLIQANDLTSVTGTKIINSGTGTTIIGNIGYP